MRGDIGDWMNREGSCDSLDAVAPHLNADPRAEESEQAVLAADSAAQPRHARRYAEASCRFALRTAGDDDCAANTTRLALEAHAGSGTVDLLGSRPRTPRNGPRAQCEAGGRWLEAAAGGPNALDARGDRSARLGTG